MKNKIYFSLFPEKTFLFHASIAHATMPTLFVPTGSRLDICWLFTKTNILLSFLSFPASSFSYVLFENTGEVLVSVLFWGWRGRRAGQRVVLGPLVFFLQCQPHLSFSAILRPQITASIPQPIFPFLLPNKFH